MSDSIWNVLSAINVNEHVKEKGGFSYLSWTWAWAMVKERYPYADYELLPDVVYPDGTMEVRVQVSISTQVAVDSAAHQLVFNELKHTMWLPVLDFRNKAIANPDAFAINSSRMRCLVKALAMFGLGHYIYSGESAPQEPPRETYTPELRQNFIDMIANKDGWNLKRLGQEWGNEIMSDLFSSFKKGEVSKNKALVREYVGQANQGLKDGLEAIDRALVEGESSDYVTEIVSEMEPTERGFVIAGLTEIQKNQLTEMGVEL